MLLSWKWHKLRFKTSIHSFKNVNFWHLTLIMLFRGWWEGKAIFQRGYREAH